MGYIYIIKNTVNNYVYIGQTTRSLEVRWKEHLRHANQSHKQVLGMAITKYGKDKFFIEELEECEDSLLNERERYWISYFDSFNNGYNTTLGGSDNFIMTSKVEEVLTLWKEGKTINKIVEITKLNVETVRGYLNKNGITHEMIRIRANKAIGQSKAKSVLQFDLNGNFIQEWESTMAVERELGFNHRNISAVCNGKRKTCGKFIWKYKEYNNGKMDD